MCNYFENEQSCGHIEATVSELCDAGHRYLRYQRRAPGESQPIVEPCRVRGVVEVKQAQYKCHRCSKHNEQIATTEVAAMKTVREAEEARRESRRKRAAKKLDVKNSTQK